MGFKVIGIGITSFVASFCLFMLIQPAAEPQTAVSGMIVETPTEPEKTPEPPPQVRKPDPRTAEPKQRKAAEVKPPVVAPRSAPKLKDPPRFVVTQWNRGKTIEMTLRCDITSKEAAPDQRRRKLLLTTVLPRSIPDRQKILKMTFEPEPVKIFEADGNQYARFSVTVGDRPAYVAIHAKIMLLRYDLTIASQPNGGRRIWTDAELQRYLVPERSIECDNALIRLAAERLTGLNDVDTVRKCLDYVVQTMRYVANKEDRGALRGLRDKHGDCSEYSDLFVALCRAKKIPARTCFGYVAMKGVPNDQAGHAWAEVYLRGCGWVPFDPTNVQSKFATFDKISPTSST